MTEYRVVDGIASTPKGQQLYDQAIANQNVRIKTNEEHTIKIAGVSNKPYTHAKYGKFTAYATPQQLIERGFPTVDGIVTPVTEQQAQQEGMSSDGRGKNYIHFWKYTRSPQSKNTTQAVLDRQEIYRKITGKPTFAFHGCKNGMCPTWTRYGSLASNILKKYDTSRGKLNNAPVETSDTMFEGIHRRFLPKPKIIPPSEPEPEPEPEIIEETKTDEYPIAIIMGILVIVIIIILRGKKNA